MTETCQAFVREYVHSSRVCAGEVFLVIGSAILLVVQAILIKQSIYCESTWVSPMQRITLLVLSVVMGMSQLTSRGALSQALPDFVFVTITVAATFMISPICVTREIIQVSAIALRPVRGLMALICLDVRRIAAGNTVYMAVLLWSISSHRAYGLLTSFLVQEVVFWGGSCFLAMLAREMVAFAAKKNLDIDVATRSLDVANIMLRYFCDVVTELDSNLQFSKHSHQLAATLLMNPERSCEGLKFMKLVSEADQEKVERDLSVLLTTDRSHTNIFKVSLRDSNGTDVVMDIFAVAFVDAFGVRYIFLGMREVSKEVLQFGKSRDDLPVVERGVSCPRDGYVGDEDIAIGSDAALTDDSLSSLPCMRTTRRKRSRSQSSHKTNSITSVLAYPYFKETSVEAKLTSLVEVFCSWNVRIPTKGCCVAHAILNDVERTMRVFVTSKCKEFLLPTFEHQCSGCGILSSDPLTSTCCENCAGEQDDGFDGHSKISL
eukprot:TRINITY_DN8477_c0_g2_i1.p1 TRINITY_DN8477_c0_g2~~TRINITY_DN8477_c0_g2_i1.p1  ORF type:complete len:570 (+),score=58.89 TRINITY_DN8477_c0_g2_i1:243-1712(+)